MDRLVADVDQAVGVDRQHQRIVDPHPDLLGGDGPRQGDLDPAVEHRGGDHEDDQEHQHHVDQGRDVDVRHRAVVGVSVEVNGHPR